MRKKEIILGFLFSIVITIFINYGSIERLFNISGGEFARGLSHIIFPMAWSVFVSMSLYIFFTYAFKMLDKKYNVYVLVSVILGGALVLSYLWGELAPAAREWLLSEPVLDHVLEPEARNPRRLDGRRETNILVSRHILIAFLNLLFVYILRLTYVNQEIRIRNEHLQLENVKAEHNALVQQINPHFFFNSLNGLSYFISTKDTDEAMSYLENLTAVFRQILKNNNKDTYTLGEELEFIRSYIYMLSKRYEGKLFFEFDIFDKLLDYQIPRLALLPLVENIVKHNKISNSSKVTVRIYTNELSQVVVENNVVAKLDNVESTGIGLTNLAAQYKLLTQKDIVVTRDIQGLFRVALPLLKTNI